ncbi:MAG: hypothetical protein DRN20_06080 [Thermoplasmata archaeon]|nr:MAG: hypothetical protein DRN20_06080 [Thermoplasmata archaeon]
MTLNPKLDSSCVLALQFGEPGGKLAADQSIYEHHGTIYGATRVKAIGGRGLQFDGVDDFVEIPEWGLGQYDKFTLSFWAYRYEENKEDDVMSNDGSDEDLLVVRLGDHSNWQEGKFMIYWGDSGYAFLSNTKIYKNRWYFIVVTGDLTTKRFQIYINGVLDRDDIYTHANKWSASKIYLGKLLYEYYKGIVADVRIYDGILSLKKIQALYIAPRRKIRGYDLNIVAHEIRSSR